MIERQEQALILKINTALIQTPSYLLITIRFQEGHVFSQTVVKSMLITFIKTFTASFVNKRHQIHLKKLNQDFRQRIWIWYKNLSKKLKYVILSRSGNFGENVFLF